MHTSGLSDEQMVRRGPQAESGTPVVEICRKLGITETTSYRYKNGGGWFRHSSTAVPLAVVRDLIPRVYRHLRRLD